MIIKSNKIVLENEVVSGYIIFEKGKIVDILSSESKLEADEDYGDNRIIPGIFDTHNHGTYGYGLRAEEDRITDNDINQLNIKIQKMKKEPKNWSC